MVMIRLVIITAKERKAGHHVFLRFAIGGSMSQAGRLLYGDGRPAAASPGSGGAAISPAPLQGARSTS
jgi:hypothetical protein